MEHIPRALYGLYNSNHMPQWRMRTKLDAMAIDRLIGVADIIPRFVAHKDSA